jgi:DNA adenine methylase
MTLQAFPYQGSKRLIAATILKYVPKGTQTLFEPFCGSAALSVAALSTGRASRVVLNDSYKPLIALWRAIVEDPKPTIYWYRSRWGTQTETTYDAVRAYFNDIEPSDRYNDPSYTSALLYLLCRCVKGAVRFNKKGEFNQSADKRRLGRHPDKMAEDLTALHLLLQKRSKFSSTDFYDFIRNQDFGDRSLVYFDPPYEGVGGKDKRYYEQLADGDSLINGLDWLNREKVPYLLSFDGTARSTRARKLRRMLSLQEIQINAGRSAQATLLGRKVITKESIYISPILRDRLSKEADFSAQ